MYRLDAFDADGSMLLSMEIAARVIDQSVPKAGDPSLPVGAAIALSALSGAALALKLRRRARV